jgi:hypothetical protein
MILMILWKNPGKTHGKTISERRKTRPILLVSSASRASFWRLLSDFVHYAWAWNPHESTKPPLLLGERLPSGKRT